MDNIMLESDEKCCRKCTEPTKHIAGFWDGVDPNGNDTSGCFYDCNNIGCGIKMDRVIREAAAEDERQRIRVENADNRTDASTLVDMRKAAQCTLRIAADIAGISVSEYSAMEQERKVIPSQLYNHLVYTFGIMKEDQDDVTNNK